MSLIQVRTEASVVALAAGLEARVLITLGRRRFGAVRPSHVDAFEILPSGSAQSRKMSVCSALGSSPYP
ncbi:hypothetical protein DSM104329_00723 [Capillimicrobium parvum]|uniref:Uncharacterized protein n=1 Tax=Capillimicrobium parvum TaxID=2884022 RepID=A0A9E6XTZ1_9ACTN|nr:hypothetical protein DSM104329_00723 [Capillimicrobium parvum]